MTGAIFLSSSSTENRPPDSILSPDTLPDHTVGTNIVSFAFLVPESPVAELNFFASDGRGPCPVNSCGDPQLRHELMGSFVTGASVLLS
jgi:hypothetical protein